MTHKPRHTGGTPGASGPPGRNYPVSKSSVNPYKQAAESMKSVGISSVSGATTSNDKGKQAKKVQEDYKRNRQEKDKGNGLVSPLPEKKEIPIKLRKKERPTRFHKKKLEKKTAPVEKYSTTSLLSLPQQDTFGVLNNESFQEKTNNFIDAYVPDYLENILGVSYTLASAAITGNIELEKQITDKSSLNFKVDNWGNDVALIFSLELGG